MRKIFFVMFIMPLFLVLNIAAAFASGSQTEGQGIRALGMGGAFIAVSDSPEAVFYNPAGLTQIKNAEATLDITSIHPRNKYTHEANGAQMISSKAVTAPTIFLSLPISLKDALKERLYFGFGMYAPFVREADSRIDEVGQSYAKTLRMDYSPVLAYKVNDALSVGAGLIVSQGKTKQNFQTAYGNGIFIDDDLDGWGYSGLFGLLWKVNKQLKLGGIYRGRMVINETGSRTQTPLAFGFPATHASADVRYPAQAGLGIAYTPNEKLTLACDIDWTDWKYFYKVVTKIDNQADSTTMADFHDTVEYHLGLEYKLNSTTTLRTGFTFVPAASPSEWINPCKPDYDKWYVVSLGASKSWKNLELGFLYEYLFSNKWDVWDNAALYNGCYEFNMHVFGVEAKYRF